MEDEILKAAAGDLFAMREGTTVTYMGVRGDRRAFRRPNGDTVYLHADGRLFERGESSLDVVARIGTVRRVRKNTFQSDVRCRSTKCAKYQCWRHCKNHSDAGASDLNPNDETRCPYYISKFERANIERGRRKKVYGSEGEGGE